MNEMEARQQIVQSEQAAQVISNPAYKKAINDIKMDLLEQFEQTSHRQEKKRKDIWLEIKMLGKIQDKLERSMENGRVINHSMKDKVKQLIR